MSISFRPVAQFVVLAAVMTGTGALAQSSNHVVVPAD